MNKFTNEEEVEPLFFNPKLFDSEQKENINSFDSDSSLYPNFPLNDQFLPYENFFFSDSNFHSKKVEKFPSLIKNMTENQNEEKTKGILSLFPLNDLSPDETQSIRVIQEDKSNTEYKEEAKVKEDIDSSNKKENGNDQIKSCTEKQEKLNETIIVLSSEELESIKKKYLNIIQYRTDYYIKYFKVSFSKWLKDFANKLLSKWSSKKKTDCFCSPNSKSFTGNSKESANYAFLSEKIQNIFIYGKDTQGGSLQIKNEKLINKIFACPSTGKCDCGLDELQNFLNLNLEEVYEKYYSSKEFIKFCNEEKTMFFDYYFEKEKGFSLRKKFGFINMIKKFQSFNK